MPEARMRTAMQPTTSVLYPFLPRAPAPFAAAYFASDMNGFECDPITMPPAIRVTSLKLPSREGDRQADCFPPPRLHPVSAIVVRFRQVCLRPWGRICG